jgi:hypothetical protein
LLLYKLITTSKRKYYSNKISSNQGNPKKLWKSLDALLGRNLPKSLPCTISPSALAYSLLNFFNDKIANLCAATPDSVNYVCPQNFLSSSPPPLLSNFTPTTDEIRNIILSSSDATCSLDIIPTKLLKSCLDSLLIPITHLVNLSLAEGVFPDAFKHAIVSPLIKKQSLPKDDLSSYRPT